LLFNHYFTTLRYLLKTPRSFFNFDRRITS
jgi:hypothetical protein